MGTFVKKLRGKRTMYVMHTITYPLDIAVPVVKKWIEVSKKQFPSFIKTHHMLNTADLSNGIKTIAIYEVDDEKYKEATIEFAKMFTQFYEFQGFRYQIEPMLMVTGTIT